jgi:amidase
METELTRRGLIAVVATTGAAALAPPTHAAADAPANDEPTYRTGSDLLGALAAREISSRELVDAAIARIEAVNSRINAVVVKDYERARAAADAADAARARGESKPLLGLPMTVKEQFNIAGLPTTWGRTDAKGWMPPGDALVVSRLKAAGAVILGKTNVPLNLGDWQSYNEIYGSTNNPWDLGRSPGGSSGGSAAALAAGLVPLELGSDIGGSLRAPAHYCGVFSHKPSLNLIPMRGSGPPQVPINVPVGSNLAVLGPMARSAADLALALDVLAGPDAMWDGIGYKLALPPPRHDRLADYRVLVIDTHPLFPTAKGVSGALNTLVDALGRAGCKVSRTDPAMPSLAFLTRNYVELLAAEDQDGVTPEIRARMLAEASALPPDDDSLHATYLRGATMPHAAAIQAGYIRIGLRARWQALFAEHDVIVCPPMPTAAFPHDHSPQSRRRIDVDGRSLPYDDQIVWATIPTHCGFPSTTVPVVRTDKGLPVGVQIIGGYLSDRTTLAFAGLIEREYGGFVRPPGF